MGIKNDERRHGVQAGGGPVGGYFQRIEGAGVVGSGERERVCESCVICYPPEKGGFAKQLTCLH